MSTKIYASQDWVEERLSTIDVPDKSDFISAPSTASVGQTIIVKAVDENGKPTEWEAVDPFVLTDESTGIKYKLSVSDSKLTMNEVASG